MAQRRKEEAEKNARLQAKQQAEHLRELQLRNRLEAALGHRTTYMPKQRTIAILKQTDGGGKKSHERFPQNKEHFAIVKGPAVSVVSARDSAALLPPVFPNRKPALHKRRLLSPSSMSAPEMPQNAAGRGHSMLHVRFEPIPRGPDAMANLPGSPLLRFKCFFVAKIPSFLNIPLQKFLYSFLVKCSFFACI